MRICAKGRILLLSELCGQLLLSVERDHHEDDDARSGAIAPLCLSLSLSLPPSLPALSDGLNSKQFAPCDDGRLLHKNTKV